jgi:preprotein translocase subunit YajC
MMQPSLPSSLVLRPEFRTAATAVQDNKPAAGPEPKAVNRDQGVDGKASTTAPSQEPGAAPSMNQCLQGMWPILIMLPLMYFVLLRPQMKQEKERKAMISSLKKGARVVTSGGMHGEVVAIRDNEVTLRISSDKDLRVVFDRSAIGRVVDPGKGDNGAETGKPDGDKAKG